MEALKAVGMVSDIFMYVPHHPHGYYRCIGMGSQGPLLILQLYVVSLHLATPLSKSGKFKDLLVLYTYFYRESKDLNFDTHLVVCTYIYFSGVYNENSDESDRK